MKSKKQTKEEQTDAGNILSWILKLFTKQKNKIDGRVEIAKNNLWAVSIVLALLFTIFLIFFVGLECILYIIVFLLLFLYFIKTYEIMEG